MVDNKLLQDETQRAANYESVKSTVKTDVAAEIASRADDVRDDSRLANIAGGMREKAVDEVVETHREVERGRAFARVSQVVDYVFCVIYGLLALRLLLALFAARSSAGFVQFIYSVTDPLYAPFRGIVPSPSVEGGYTLALPIVFALIVYGLVHLAINGLLRIFVHRKTEI